MDELTKKRYLTEKEVSDLTSIPLSSLRNSRFYKKNLPFIKFGKSVRYALNDVISFMEIHKITTDSNI